MDLLSNVPLALFQGFLLFIIAKIVSNIKYKTRDYLIVLAIIIPSALLYYFFGSISILYLLISCGIFFYYKIKFYSIITVLGSAILMFLSNFIVFFLIIFIENTLDNQYLILMIYLTLFSLISIILAYTFKIVFKKFKQSYLSINKTYLIIITIVLVSSFIILLIYSQTPRINNASLKIYGLIFIGIIIFFITLIIIISRYTLRELRYRRNMEEIETYYEYTLQIESINNEMRKFRHDYVNILTTMSEYIRENDMDGLKTYFNDNIVPMKDNLQMNSIKINGTDNLKVRAIKGLITTKILQAQEKIYLLVLRCQS